MKTYSPDNYGDMFPSEDWADMPDSNKWVKLLDHTEDRDKFAISVIKWLGRSEAEALLEEYKKENGNNI